jgi:demethylmenaquinone methyltransferase/2-methoxy-6-polyprenyl-1,4-benzoquinol methylase
MTPAPEVRAMFTRIAGRYDLMNSLMTGGRHHAWRRVAASAVRELPPGPVLDLATGTADLALELRRADPTRRVVGADFSGGMLREGQKKLAARGEHAVTLVTADALDVPFADASFAAVTSAFLLRNLADLRRGLAEMRRVTMKDGAVIALEIVQPTLPGWAPLFNVYFRRLVPMVGALVAGDRQAYTYLPRSVAGFVTPRALAELMTQAGLRDVCYRRLGLGTIAIHVGRA